MNEKAVDLALKVAQVTRERDEARAELKRLQDAMSSPQLCEHGRVYCACLPNYGREVKA